MAGKELVEFIGEASDSTLIALYEVLRAEMHARVDEPRLRKNFGLLRVGLRERTEARQKRETKADYPREGNMQ